MVVLTDTDPSSPTKSQQGWPSQAGTSVAGSEAPQSPFGGPSSQAQFVPPPPAYEPDPRAPLLPGPGPQKPPRRSRTVAKRFCSAFSIAIFIFIALSILKEIIFGSISWSPEPIYWDNVPKPKDGNVVYCTSEWPEGGISVSEQAVDAAAIPGIPVFSTSKSFSLPINSSLHYLITRGGISSGLVTLRGDENADPNTIGVKVVARYHTRHALSRARICELKKTEGGVGVGVYTPSSRIEIGEREEDKIYFIITVTVPTSHKSVLNLNGFETKTNNFRHSVENLGNRVHFDHISLLGTNGAIQTDQVFLSQGKFVTTNGKITGKFSATDSLVLRTTNGLIDTEVDITNDDTHKASDLLLETTNGRLTSKISLLTTHDQRPQPKGGHFTVKATTSNGRLDISYPNTPVNSLLDFEGVTTNGPAEVSLHAAYEGTFRVASSGSTELDNENVVDPSGRKRIRNLRTSRYSSRLIEGVVHWGPEQDRNAEMGSASIKTTNGEATLRLI